MKAGSRWTEAAHEVLHWNINLSRAGSLSSGPDAPRVWQSVYCPDCAFPPFVQR
jgi:hypothetical protein